MTKTVASLLYKELFRILTAGKLEREQKFNKAGGDIDCDQSLSLPRVAICEGRARAARSADAEEEEKERDCGGILIFSICRL